jgi:hypothetical protein
MLIRPTDAAPRPEETRPSGAGAWQVLLTIEAGAAFPASSWHLDGVAPSQAAAPEGFDGVHSWPGGA